MEAYREIITATGKTYLIPCSDPGEKIEDHFAARGLPVPLSMAGMRVFETEDGPVIVHVDDNAH
jgi:hypothetical protein